MNILMFSNTYRPHVGGVARSISLFREALVNRGHNVLIVAPCFEKVTTEGAEVIRIHAVTDFNRSGFSLPLALLSQIRVRVDAFQPDIIHAHHPFLLGNTALRCSARLGRPLVYTYHTLYEHYTHYIPGDSKFLRRFVVFLSASYCALCDAVIVPSASMAQLLGSRGVHAKVHILPTGIDHTPFAAGDGAQVRRREGIPQNGFVIGHVGRLVREKNLEFLALCMARCLIKRPTAHALVVGTGPMEARLRQIFDDHKVADRLHMLGVLRRSALADAYHAMDVFVFSSRSETQGIVLIEAMAAGRPVVALDGPGVRDVVRDRCNGRLVVGEDIDAFVRALLWIEALSKDRRNVMKHDIAMTVAGFCLNASADNLLDIYKSTLAARGNGFRNRTGTPSRAIETQARIIEIYLNSAFRAMQASLSTISGFAQK
jgi:1,2-diacylglycerol 3-alpha-glucosyltransferase